jgi:hypothetical protein
MELVEHGVTGWLNPGMVHSLRHKSYPKSAPPDLATKKYLPSSHLINEGKGQRLTSVRFPDGRKIHKRSTYNGRPAFLVNVR